MLSNKNRTGIFDSMSRGENTRTVILAAARELLEESDGSPVSMGGIADRAGVTRQLLYHHFSGRGDLLLELSRAIDREVRDPAHQERVDKSPDGLIALREAVALQGHIKPQIHAVVQALDRLRDHDPDAARAYQEREDARRRCCTDVLQRLKEDRQLRSDWDVPSAAMVMAVVTSQEAWRVAVTDGPWDTAEWVAHTTHLLESALVSTDR